MYILDFYLSAQIITYLIYKSTSAISNTGYDVNDTEMKDEQHINSQNLFLKYEKVSSASIIDLLTILWVKTGKEKTGYYIQVNTPNISIPLEPQIGIKVSFMRCHSTLERNRWLLVKYSLEHVLFRLPIY